MIADLCNHREDEGVIVPLVFSDLVSWDCGVAWQEAVCMLKYELKGFPSGLLNYT